MLYFQDEKRFRQTSRPRSVVCHLGKRVVEVNSHHVKLALACELGFIRATCLITSRVAASGNPNRGEPLPAQPRVKLR